MSHKNTLKRTLYSQENNAVTFFSLLSNAKTLQCLLRKPISSELQDKKYISIMYIWSIQICRESVFEKRITNYNHNPLVCFLEDEEGPVFQ